jgi:hypothetical protein
MVALYCFVIKENTMLRSHRYMFWILSGWSGCLLILLAVPAIFTQEQPTPTPNINWVRVETWINVRSGPGVGSMHQPFRWA